jgi:hypothetical protein
MLLDITWGSHGATTQKTAIFNYVITYVFYWLVLPQKYGTESE